MPNARCYYIRRAECEYFFAVLSEIPPAQKTAQQIACIAAGFHIDFLIHFNLPAYTKLFRAEPGRNVSDQFGGHSLFQKDGNGSLDDFLTDYLREYDATKGKGYISIPTGNHDMPRISVQRTKRELESCMRSL